MTAVMLAVFGGNFGVHRLFLGQWWGICYLLMSWTLLPGVLALAEGIGFLTTRQEKWNQKYNHGLSLGSEKGTVAVLLRRSVPDVG